MEMSSFRPIAQQFARAVTSIQPIGNGYINDTYLVGTDAKPFVLQKINKRVFPHPELIMANLEVLSQHLRQANDKQISLKIPELLLTETSVNFFIDEDGEYWRALTFIDNTESLETLDNLAQAGQVGFALGQFHRITWELDVGKLHDTLPGFHITPQYLAQYSLVRTRPDVLEDAFLEAARNQGLLRERVIHGDPKLNNFLFDKASQHIVSLIDLDTVKPGLIHYDLGDCVRSCCHDLETDEFRLEVFHTFLGSYLEQMGEFISQSDLQFLYPAIRLIPFELGIRFYTDFLAGNRYFKVTEPQQNLQRAIGQFRLCANIMAKESEINSLINRQSAAFVVQ
jgi:Ser/Thr protein kinase RdoA (MazF antagonist)